MFLIQNTQKSNRTETTDVNEALTKIPVIIPLFHGTRRVTVDESPIDLTTIVRIMIGGAAVYQKNVYQEPRSFRVPAVCTYIS